MRNAINGTAGIAPLHPRVTVMLTEREFEVFTGLWEGLSNSKIGGRLFIDKRTVETHRKKLYMKTGVKSFMQFVKFVYKNKWVDDDGNIIKENVPVNKKNK